MDIAERCYRLVGDMPWVTEHLTKEQIGDLRLQIAASMQAAFDDGETLAKGYRESDKGSDRNPEGTLESLERCATMLNTYAPDCFPANEKGQIHFARAMMESTADEITAYVAATKATLAL